MIRLTYGQLRALNFAHQMNSRLFSTPLPPKTARKLKRIFDDLNTYSNRISSELQEHLVKPFAVTDDKGNVVSPDGRPADFQVKPELLEEFGKAQKDFYERPIIINRPQMSIEDFEPVNLSVAELALLEPFIISEADDKPTVQGETDAKVVNITG